MIRHHPDDALLMALAAGSLAPGPALLGAVHAELCRPCRLRLRELDALGGALLEAAEPAVLQPEALALTLARIDGSTRRSLEPLRSAAAAPASQGARIVATSPAGMRWPAALAACTTTGWRRLGPGMRWSRVTLPADRAANVFLLRIAAGKSLPAHSHRGVELTQVLHGAFHDGRQRFDAGDFDEADGEVHHQPVVEPGCECICLASVEGRVAFDGSIARVLGALLGM